MPSVAFQKRLVFDINFYNDMVQGKLNSIPAVYRQLLSINDRAKGYKKTFNVMSKKTFNKILETNPDMDRGFLRGAFYDLYDAEIEKVNDELERNIKLAIDLLDQPPHNTIIITSEDKLKEYKENPHFKGVKEIDVKAGKDALAILDSYFADCSCRD